MMGHERRGAVAVRPLLVSALALVGVVLAVWSTAQFLRGEPERRSLSPSVSAEGWEPIEELETEPDPEAEARLTEAEARRSMTHDFDSVRGPGGAESADRIAESTAQALSGFMTGSASAGASRDLIAPVLASAFSGSEDAFLVAAASESVVVVEARESYEVLFAALKHLLEGRAVAPDAVSVTRMGSGPGIQPAVPDDEPSLSMSVDTNRRGGPPPGTQPSGGEEPERELTTATILANNVLTPASWDANAEMYAVEFPVRHRAGTGENATQHVRLLVVWLPSPGRWHLAGVEMDTASREDVQALTLAMRNAREAQRDAEGG